MALRGGGFQESPAAKYVPSCIEFSRRRELLSYSHHRDVRYAIILPMNTVTIPKLPPDALPDPRPMPELFLLAAVVKLALRDLQGNLKDMRRTGEHQADTRAFIASPELELFCDWLEWDVEKLRGVERQAVSAIFARCRYLH